MGCQPKCGTAFGSDFGHVEVTAHVGLSPRNGLSCKTAHVHRLTSPHALSADTHGRQQPMLLSNRQTAEGVGCRIELTVHVGSTGLQCANVFLKRNSKVM
nr:hypothetical protein Iba_chr02bCG8980 [Ipomoea batatas]